MKNLSPIFLLLIISLHGYSKNMNGEVIPSTNVTECKPVKWVVEYTSGSKIILKYSFDSDGNVIGSRYYINGKLKHEHKNYQYDEYGNNTYFERYNKKGILLLKSTRTYQAYGKILTLINENTKSGRVISKEYSYNSDGNQIGFKDYYDGVLILENRNYEHDEYGNVTYYESFDQDGLSSSKSVITFQGLEKPITYISEDSLGDVEKREYSYNSEGNEIGKRYYTNGKLKHEHKNYQYDEYGNNTYFELYNKEGILMCKFTVKYKCK